MRMSTSFCFMLELSSCSAVIVWCFFFFQAEDGIRDLTVTGVQTCALPICRPDTPVLMITGHGGHALTVQALRAGADDFIQKPIDRDYFVASLRRAIQGHALDRKSVV